MEKEEKETKGKITKNVVNPKVNAASHDTSEIIPQLTAYEIFEKCIIRAENLISIQTFTVDVERISEQHYCDCYRAAIVLSISALDAYIRKIVISEIVKMFLDKKPLNENLRKYIKELLNQDKLLDAVRDYDIIKPVEDAIKEDFGTKSFQGEWKISYYLGLLGHENIFSKVADEANISEKILRKNIEIFTKRRHIIAHSGDYDLNQNPHKENEIKIDDVKKCIDVVKTFVQNINKIIINKKQ
ncbi:MAG: hypothetical protein LBU34_08725 [Planctomycetaceae bacterium]|jgi:uncharacterized protein (UPF0332 family)|nr:hypothetical protein [Planctomycetaceae bacterium]